MAASLARDGRREMVALFGLTAPALMLVAATLLAPLIWLSALSFVDGSGAVSLENYLRMIDGLSHVRIFSITFQVSILTTLVCVVMGFPLAYLIAQLPPRPAALCLFAVLLPFWTSLLVRTYAWLVLLQRKGVVNELGMNLGFWDEPLQLIHDLSGTMIGMAHVMLPFLVLPLLATMRTIPDDCMKAAATLGATPTRAFWTVWFPLSLPGLFAGMLIVFVLSLGFFVTPALLGGGRVIMVSMKIASNIELFVNWGAASALGVVLMIATLVVLWIASKLVSMPRSGGEL